MLFVPILVVIIAVSSVVTGLLVVLRNHRSRVNLEFFAVCLLAAAWGLAFEATQIIYLSNADPKKTGLLSLLNGASFLLGLLLMYSVVVFSFSFPKERNKNALIAFTPFVAITAMLSFSPYIAGTVSIQEGKFIISDGTAGLLYILVMLAGIVMLVLNIALNRTKLNSIQKGQQKLLAFGFGSSLTVGLILAVIIGVILFPDSGIDQASPLAVVFFLLPVAAAVSRYKLFEFRAVLVRSLAYVLTIAALLLLYVVTGLGLSILFTGGLQNLSYQTIAVFIAVSIVSAISFTPLKKVFDSYTNKLFFRDAYEPQNLLNDLNSSLATLININEIMKSTSLILDKYLKPTYVAFYVHENQKDASRMFSTTDINKSQQQAVTQLIRKFPEKVTGVSDNDNLTSEFRNTATDLNIELVAHIASYDKSTSSVGSIVFGPKKSGSLYGKEDYRIVEIIADELVIALQNALRFEEIQQFNATLQKKVDDATKELKKANEKLIALDQTKDDFISMASHQLRTPLTSVKGYISMVVEGDVGKITKQQHKLLDQAFLSSQRMVYLIADLLNVSRLKTGKFIIEPKPTNLAELVEGELSQLTETAKSRNLTLNYAKPANFPLLMLDDTKTRQVVMNFADNAIYYTMSGGKIDVKVEDTGKTIEFTVTDNGIGVPKNERHNLFSKFYRANNAKKARPDGTGLGLFMAKKVIIAQGGSIIFKSEEGKGSTFGFSFDKAKLKAPDTKSDKHKLDESDTKLQ